MTPRYSRLYGFTLGGLPQPIIDRQYHGTIPQGSTCVWLPRDDADYGLTHPLTCERKRYTADFLVPFQVLGMMWFLRRKNNWGLGGLILGFTFPCKWNLFTDSSYHGSICQPS